MSEPRAGTSYTFERTFTVEDVQKFATLSRDTQSRHTVPNEDDRLMVHGLLTATLPTKIGGDLEVLAHTVEFEFTRPVYTGETITCTWTTDEVTEREDRYDLRAVVTAENEADEVVLRATIDGLVWKEDVDG